MKKSLAILAAVGMATAASAQDDSWQFELVGGAGTEANPLTTSNPTATVRLSIGAPAGDYGLGGVGWDTHAGEEGWSNPTALLTHPGQTPGTVDGSSVNGATAGQLYLFGFTVTPGRIDVWEADYSPADLETAREISLSTTTNRYQVYATDPNPGVGPGPVERGLPTEGAGSVFVVPAPASLALLGLGGLAAARRRR